MLSRRQALNFGAAVSATVAAVGCARQLQRFAGRSLPEKLPELPPNPGPIVRLLNRAAFGPELGEAAKLEAEGKEAYVERQLRAEEPEPPYLVAMLHRLDALRIEAAELRDLPEAYVLKQLQQAVVLRAVYSPNQLRERMVDLWSNHFNIYARKAEGAYFKPSDDLKVIRKHAFGKFSTLLRASAKSPAMLRYLDNQENRKGVPNENYARELLELHTLGVDGGYEYKDIKEVARCLTGWTVEHRFLRPYGKWRFDPELHDDGAKTVLGRSIPPGLGEKDVDVVLDILLEHPSTTRFIAKKVCRYFLGDAADAWVPQTAETFRKTGGDIRAMLKPILLSHELSEGPPILKRPLDFVVSALRATGAETDADTPLLEHLDKMGQPPFEWPMPDGYPDTTAAWTGSLLARWNFALALSSGSIPGTRARLSELFGASERPKSNVLLELTTGRRDLPSDDPLVEAVRQNSSGGGAEGDEALALAVCLASPVFQWR